MFRTTVAVCMLLMGAALGFAQDKAELGKSAPQFTLNDSSGKPVSLSDFAGKIVVLEWVNPQCPVVQRHYEAGTMKALADKFGGKIVWLAIDSTGSATPADDAAWITQYALPYPILSDTSGTVGKAYGAKTTPHMFIIDQQGKLVYRGGIDNDPQGGNPERTNYVGKALNELLAGQTVTQAETRSYGCGVKYK